MLGAEHRVWGSTEPGSGSRPDMHGRPGVLCVPPDPSAQPLAA